MIRLPILFVVLLLLLERTILAGISAPNSSATFSADGRNILVMRSPVPADDNTPQITFPDGRVLRIRDAFPKSGCYDATTLSPHWQVDWFAFPYELRWSPDFQHVARLNRFGIDSDWAIAFYDQGRLLQTYDCQFLLTRMRNKYFLDLSTWDWHIRWHDDFSLVPSSNYLSVKTIQRGFWLYGRRINLGVQESYTFDISTGSLMTSTVTGTWVPWAYMVAMPLLLFGMGYGLWKCVKLARRWVHQRARNRRGFPVEI